VRERDRLSIKAHREEIAEQERAEREMRERPVREAEEQLKKTTAALAKEYRMRLRGEVRDPDLFIDPAVSGIGMSRAQADKFNSDEFKKFLVSRPDTYLGSNDEVVQLIARYFTKNKIEIAKLIDRMSEYGLLPARLQAEPEPVPELTPEPIEQTKPEAFEGWDLESGEPRIYTRREVDRMSGDEYRRAFRIYKAALELPNSGPGPRASR